jgi:hypothetical protein
MGNLDISQVAVSQNNKETTINDATNGLDIAVTEILISDYTSGNITLTDDEYRQHILFRTVNLSVPRNLTVPAIKRFALIDNADGSDTLTVVRGASTVEVVATTTLIIYTDGTTDGLIAIGAAGGGGGSNTLAGLDDVTITSPQAGDFLTFDGADWINGGGLSQANWAVPFRGALVHKNATQSVPTGFTTPATITWNLADYDTDSFWAGGNPTRLTIPAGITKVRLIAGIRTTAEASAAAHSRRLEFLKSGAAFSPGQTTFRFGQGTTAAELSMFIVSPVITVAETDYFEVIFAHGSGETLNLMDDGDTFFGIEVYEVSDAQARPYDIGVFVPGLPGNGALVLQHVAVRDFRLPMDAVGSETWAGVDPDAEAVFDVRKNGVSVGSLDFAIASNTGVFSIASDEDFAPGDRLELVAPSPQDAALADVSVTFMMELI